MDLSLPSCPVPLPTATSPTCRCQCYLCFLKWQIFIGKKKTPEHSYGEGVDKEGGIDVYVF